MVSDRDGYSRVKAKLCDLLELLRMGVVFERAEGDHLLYRRDGREVEVLDLVGGFGSLLLGHNHPDLIQAARDFLGDRRPIHAQASLRAPAGRLAGELSRRAGGDFRVVFANSGAEAVEAAMKHAMLETGSRTFVALEGAFHGKTLGAIQLISNEEYRTSFELDGIEVLRVRPNDIPHLEETFLRASDIAGFIFEPIQGEGGVRPLDAAFLQRAAELCADHRAPMIADEIQTGMGRTGTFLACEALGVKPDYVTLSKALGGGLAKISALLIRREAYHPDFDLKHTSTYAEDDYSSTIALRTLELIDDDLLQRCREKGDRILVGLRERLARFPDVLADVRGRGLMIGLEFHSLLRSRSFMLRLMSSQEDLALMIAGYLFNVHRIRVFSTLSDPFTLRIEPSSFISEEDIERFFRALDDVCARLRHGDSLGLTGHLLRHTNGSYVDEISMAPKAAFTYWDQETFRRRESSAPPIRLGWLCHLIDASSFPHYEGQFASLSLEKREDYLRHFAPRVAPVVVNSVDVRSITGRKVRLHAIMLPFTSGQVRRWMDEHNLKVAQRHVQAGIDVARSLGCSIVALGQYTSIVTYNGTRVRAKDLGVTTGNSYTAVLSIQAVEKALEESPIPASEAVLAVVGAAGNIGRACAEILAPRFRRAILLGSNRPGAEDRLREVAQHIPNAEVVADPWALQGADVVVAATNATDAPLGPDYFKRNAVVCDLSIPASVHPDTWGHRPDLLPILGGVCKLPFEEDLEIPGLPLPKGQTYACMAEGFLLGWEGLFDHRFTGRITTENAIWTAEAARRHGIQLADFKSRSVLGAQPEEEESPHAIPF